MKILISCAGYSDPIRNYHDGSLLHLARVVRPEKIVIIHSEKSQKMHSNIVYALERISAEYQPEITQAKEVIHDVAYFDRVYRQISEIVEDLVNEKDEFYVNLSSGTPQMKSALFAINQIYDYNFHSMQVMTPTGSSNAGIRHEDTEDIEALVETNIDNQENFNNRVVEDQAIKFSQTLTVRNLITLIDHYDYKGALDLIEIQKGFPNRKFLFNRLKNEIIPDLQRNNLPKEIQKLEGSDAFKKSLFSFLIIQMNNQKGEIAEVLVRMQSLTEYMLAHYLMMHYPNIFTVNKGMNFLNQSKYPEIEEQLVFLAEEAGHTYKPGYLGLGKYQDILTYLEPESVLLNEVNHIMQVRHMRNAVAHNLESIPNYNHRKIRQAYQAVENMLKQIFHFDSNLLNLYDNINDELKSYL